MAPDAGQRDAETIREAVLTYFQENPQAADTVEGIATWWLGRSDVPVDQDVLADVLVRLVSEGRLEARGVDPGGRHYRLCHPREVHNNDPELEQLATTLKQESTGAVVLLAEPSATGKTMAAEVLAKSLGLALYRVDLGEVVSKYIGETEKNLAHVFDEAANAGAALFLDEADALFGKRTEVTDSHDRYASLEVRYLLQRLEEYHGVVLLATNDRDAARELPKRLRRKRCVLITAESEVR